MASGRRTIETFHIRSENDEGKVLCALASNPGYNDIVLAKDNHDRSDHDCNAYFSACNFNDSSRLSNQSDLHQFNFTICQMNGDALKFDNYRGVFLVTSDGND